jgi:sugar phosphate permease
MTVTAAEVRTPRRWVVLAVGVLAQSSVCAYVYGVPFLVPALRDTRGLSLVTAGLYVAGPMMGLLLTLVAWGAAADRWGERRVMSSGLTLGAAAMTYVAFSGSHGTGATVALLALGGATSASVFAASGRMVMGWFPRTERGVAMGIRQTSQPLGVGIAGLCLPVLADRVGAFPSLAVPAALCLLSAVLVVVLAPDPPRPPRSADAAAARSPYASPQLWRVHLASALLVVPQFAISTFSAEYLVRQQGWPAATAGAFVAVVQVVGAFGRIGTGWWSDRVRSRMRPMRQIAAGAALVLLVFALGDLAAGWLAVAALAVGGVISVAPNGLAYTAVAEIAGARWSGRALGIQNTGGNALSSAAPVVLGTVIGASGYAVGFAVAAIAPLVAIAVTPVRTESTPRW